MTAAAVVKPALLIVHGAYFVPATWQPFAQLAEAAGFEVRCPRLPTCGDASRPPTATLADDVAVVQTTAHDLQSAGYPIIVLAHSFGGVVATEAITPDLYARSAAPQHHAPSGGSSSDDDNTGVIRLVYLSAHVPPPGNSLGDVFAQHGFLCDVELDFHDDGTAIPRNAPESFYDDIPDLAARERYTRENVTHNIALVAETKVSRAPWRDLPCVYIYCERDRAVKKPLQVAMVDAVLAAGGKVETRVLDTAHNPFLSAPEKLLDVLKQVWWDAAK